MFYYVGENPAPRPSFEGVTAQIVGPASTTIPRGFLCQARAAALSGGIPVDIHIPEGDVHRLAEAVICASIERCLFNHHKMHMMPGAGACVVHVRDLHTL